MKSDSCTLGERFSKPTSFARVALSALHLGLFTFSSVCFGQPIQKLFNKPASPENSKPTVYYSRAYTGSEVLQAGLPPFSSSTPVNTVTSNAVPYNTRIARLTNNDTIANGQSFTVPGGGGSDGVVSNVAGSLIALSSTGGGTYVFGYNRTQMQVWPAENPPVSCFGASGFSRNNSRRWYCIPNTGTKLYAVDFAFLPDSPCGRKLCYDPTNATWSAIADFADCPQAPSGTPTWYSFLGVGAKDKDIAISISWTGGQSTAHLFFDYLVGLKQCVTYDTQGNGISPEWYTTSGAPNKMMNSITGTPLLATWTIHDSWSNGTWGMVPRTECNGQDCGTAPDGPPVINLEDHTGYFLSDYSMVSGHHSMSATRFYNDLNPKIEGRPMADPSTYAQLGEFSSPPCEDSHFSGDIRNDSNLLLGTRGGITTAIWTTPYMNEVYGLATDGSGTIYRFSPTWSSGPATNFYGEHAIAGFSQDRRTAFLTSDMGCQLRSDCGTDVFAIDLTPN